MNRQGHFGFTMLSTAFIAFLINQYSYAWGFRIFLAAGLSWLPDIDVKIPFLKHRGITHTFFFAVLTGVFGWFIVSYINSFGFQILWYRLDPFYDGFFIPFIAVVTHILGDIMTYSGVEPLQPFSGRRFRLKLFRSDNGVMNLLFNISGWFIFGLYIYSVMNGGGYIAILELFKEAMR